MKEEWLLNGAVVPVVFNDLTSLKHKKTVGPIESAMREQRIQDEDLMNVMRQTVWDAMAVLVEEQQRMAQRILLERQNALLERQKARIVDLQTQIENFDGEDR